MNMVADVIALEENFKYVIENQLKNNRRISFC